MDLSLRLLTKNVTKRATVRYWHVRTVHQTAGTVHSWQSATPHILMLSSHDSCLCCDVTSGRRELHVSLSKFCNTSQFAMHTTWLTVPSASFRYPNTIWQSVIIKHSHHAVSPFWLSLLAVPLASCILAVGISVCATALQGPSWHFTGTHTQAVQPNKF